MIGRRRQVVAPNAVVTPTVSFAPDPIGHQLFHGLSAAHAQYLTGGRPVIAGASWGGWAKTPQSMSQMIPAVGHGRPVTPKTSSLELEQSKTMGSPGQAIFLERMRQGRR